VRNERELKGRKRNVRRALAAISAAVAAGVIMLSAPARPAQDDAAGPFAILAGSWTGSGTIALKSGTKERIRCKAAYDVITRANVQLQITCASDSYKFSLFSNIIAAGHELSGYWSEATRNVTGRIVGRVAGNRINVRAEGRTFTALFSMTTRGNRQSVLIESPGSQMLAVQITLHQ
jgi:hypothetical protein